MKIIKRARALSSDIFHRLRDRNFSGNTGMVIKNGTYQFLTNFVSKLGSLLFTVIIARLLMPELFGLYSLAFSTILLFATISDFGISNSLVKFVSKELSKKNFKKAKSFLSYFWKIKWILIAILAFALAASAKLISDVIYNKPIFLALIAGLLYVLFYGVMIFLQAILQSLNKFKNILFGETIFQVSRLALISLAVLLCIKYSISNSLTLFFIFLALGSSYLFVSLFLWFYQTRKTELVQTVNSDIPPKQKKKVNRFILALSTTFVSGIFFSYIDRIMLGHFVAAEFIGYYTIAISFVSAASALTGIGSVLLPIFSGTESARLERGVRKSVSAFLIFSIISILLIIAFANPLISIIYGNAYLPAANLLRLLSLFFLAFPLSGIYATYFISKGKPKAVAWFSIISTLVNIALNYVLITSLLKYGDLTATFGAGIATVVSQFFYMFGLMIARRRSLKKKL
jgi:stage V sporulation protein B